MLFPFEQNSRIHLYWFPEAGGSWGLGGRVEDLFPMQLDVFDVCNARGHFCIVAAARCRCLFGWSTVVPLALLYLFYIIYLLVWRLDPRWVRRWPVAPHVPARRWSMIIRKAISDRHIGTRSFLSVIYLILLEQDPEDSWPQRCPDRSPVRVVHFPPLNETNPTGFRKWIRRTFSDWNKSTTVRCHQCYKQTLGTNLLFIELLSEG